MKLACLRCKHKKIKCDKGEPICHQCITAHSECTYVERRKRPRLAQQKVEVRNLSRRLEFLERQISNGERVSPSSPNEASPDESVNATSPRMAPPEASLVAEEGQDSWIYRLANDAKRNFEKCNTNPQNTPIDATPGPHLDSAMSALDEALEDLGKLRVRPENGMSGGTALDLSPEQAKDCVEAFINLLTTMVVPDVFVGNVDFDILRSLPDVYKSPFISIDPALLVLFYNALFYGISDRFGTGCLIAQQAYKKILEAVPAWLEGATGSDLDAHTAALTCWTSISMLDYHLSWQFHCKCCQFLQLRGMDNLDATPAKTSEEEQSRQDYRFLYFHVLQTDALFRLFYGKPGAMRWSRNKVNPPTVFSPRNMQPKASTVIMLVAWLRTTIMTTDLLRDLDTSPTNSDERIEVFSAKMEDLIVDYDLETRIRDERTPLHIRFLFADHLMSYLLMIIGMRRKLKGQPNEGSGIDKVTLRSARKVLSILFYFQQFHWVPKEDKTSVYHHFITFFPFCAIFALYEHILSCTDLTECKEDLDSLERIGDAMKHAAAGRKDFLPFSNTVNALNKVSRTMLEEKTGRTSDTSPSVSTQNMTPQTPNQPSQFPDRGFNFPSSTGDSSLNFLSSMQQDLGDSGLAFLQEFPPMDGDFQPQGFIRAVENDFMGRNWHESWWDMQGGIDTGIPLDSTTGGTPGFNMPPTPHVP